VADTASHFALDEAIFGISFAFACPRTRVPLPWLLTVIIDTLMRSGVAVTMLLAHNRHS
jgi:hypothetical protein